MRIFVGPPPTAGFVTYFCMRIFLGLKAQNPEVHMAGMPLFAHVGREN